MSRVAQYAPPFEDRSNDVSDSLAPSLASFRCDQTDENPPNGVPPLDSRLKGMSFWYLADGVEVEEFRSAVWNYRRPLRTTAVIEIVGTPTEENR